MSPGTLALTATPRGSLQGFRKAVPYSLGDQLWTSLVLGVYLAGSGSQEPAGWGSVPGRQREAQSSPAWTQLTEAGVGSAAQAPAASVRRRRKQRIFKTKSRWSVKDPRTPSPQPCPAPLHPPCCRGTLSSASKTRQLGRPGRGQAHCPAQLAGRPAPTQAAVAPAVRRAPTPRASTQLVLGSPGGAGRLFLAQPLHQAPQAPGTPRPRKPRRN